MRNTPYKGYALYEPDASPDLTETGEYNTALMAVDTDMHDEEQARIDGDTALNIAIANEMAQRKAADAALDTKFTGALNSVTQGLTAVGNGLTAEQKVRADADTALGRRIDNAEVEISTNSADLTGIKGLTYGDTHVNFIENSNGEYSSPALDEIAEQINQGFTVLEVTSAATSIDANALTKLNANWPSVALLETGTDPLADGFITPYFPFAKEDSDYLFAPTEGTYSESEPYARGISIAKTGTVSRFNIENSPYWNNVQVKPFSTIGMGLKVVDETLTVDTSALPGALTIMQLSEFGELTDNTTTPHSAIGDSNAAAYDKLKRAWPSVIVVEGGTSWRCGMYTPSNVDESGYVLVKSASINDSAIQMRIHGGGFPGAITFEEIGG